MRSAQALLWRLVRTQTGLLSLPPALPTRHLWPARALHDFGDPDKFGDLKQRLEKPREQDEGEASQPRPSTRLSGWDGDHSGSSGRSGLAKHSGNTGAKHEHRLAGSDGLDDHLTALEWSGQTSSGQTDLPPRRDHLPPDKQPSPAVNSDTAHTPSSSNTDVSAGAATADAAGGVIDWELVPDDAEDVEAEERRQAVSQVPRLGISAHAYGRKFKSMIKNGKLREALELFQNQMLQVDRVQPDAYCYNILISGCAQAGYTKMAFKLYRDMRRRRFKAKHVTYTSLLNACATGPSPSDGLRRIQQLTATMAEQGYMMNGINYQALIKAYGRCGELQRAFETADELLQLGHPLTAELASFLLQACVSDTAEGFRHALLVWHKLRSKQVEPSIYLYNLMLRAALDCGAGDTATFEQAMQLILSAPPPGGAAIATSAAPSATTGRQTANFKTSTTTESEQPGHINSSSAVESRALESADSDGIRADSGPADSVPAERRPAVARLTACLREAGALESAAGLPDLLGPRPHRGGLVQLRHLDTAPARLGVLGGWPGLLQTMAADGVRPDIRTFSLLLNTMPNQQTQEESLLRTMDALGVQPDVGFFNQLMKKRASYRNSAGAKEAFSQLEQRGLRPDVASFGCLAMAVRHMDDMDQFMDRLKAAEVRPNVEVLTALLNSAVRAADVQRSLAVMEAFVAHRVQPDRRALLRLEELRLRLQTLLVDRERGRPVPPAARRASFPEWVRTFRLRYAGWLAETEAEPERHPHQQYRVRSLAETAAAAAAPGAGAEGDEATRAGAGRQLTAGRR